MLESKVQSKKIKELEKEGWFVLKLVRTNQNGIPDILALRPGPNVKFIEVKAPGKKPTPLQEFKHKVMRALGFSVEIFDGKV